MALHTADKARLIGDRSPWPPGRPVAPKVHTADKALLIGELAAALGLNPKTIRYYEAIGLLPAPVRSESGYRRYGPADVERLRFIGKAKAIGLSLDEIAGILALRGEGTRPCEHVVALLDQKLAAVDQQLRALRDFRRELVALRGAATSQVERPAGDACICGIIERHQPAERAQPVWGPPAHRQGGARRTTRQNVAASLDIPAGWKV